MLCSRAIRALEEEHKAESLKYKTLRQEALNELSLKQAALDGKQSKEFDEASLREAIAQALNEINCTPTSSTMEDKIVHEFLMTQLELEMKQLVNINRTSKNSDLQKNTRFWLHSNCRLQDKLLELTLNNTLPNLEKPQKWPCPDCSKNPPELVEKEQSVHLKIIQALELIKQNESADVIKQNESADVVRQNKNADAIKQNESTDGITKNKLTDVINQNGSADVIQQNKNADLMKHNESTDADNENDTLLEMMKEALSINFDCMQANVVKD